MHEKVSALCAAILAAALAGSAAQASSVRQVSLDRVVAGSEVIFEGRVIAKANEDSGKTPRTCFVFAVDDVIKGSLETDTLRLCFAGGTSGKYEMSVSDVVMPKLGEHGIYLVESTTRKLINPLYGWSQGHYLILADGINPETVMTSSGLSVSGVEEVAGSKSAMPGKGTAAGIQLSRSSASAGGGKAPAMTVEAFKAVLRDMATKTRP